jgi:hypothetical protein
MRPRQLGDYLVDVFAIGLAAVVTIIVVGLFLESGVASPLYRVPFAGQILEGIRTVWQHVYDPQTV